RLRLSSEEYPGIVQLAKDKESRANLAIQSNDSRLRLSSEEYPGIVQLAKDQEIRSGLVVQSTDSRLKNGTVTKSGIIQFAKHNEFASEKAIQSDDPRLIEGSTERKGRIQFAKDLEIASLKAIQANDSRLKKATTKNYGIVCLAEHGKKIKETAVQSDDPRLEDRRKPLPHEHDYALKVHDFSSHTGNIHIESDIKTSSISNMKLPNLESMPFGIKNKSGWAGGFYGGLICKNDKEQAIFAVSENNYALEALSKNNGGALFFSENSYAVNIPSTIYNLKSSNKSLIAEGLVTLKGGLEVSGSYSVVVSWHKFSSAVFVEGDLLTINENNEIDKAKNKNDIIIGVYIKNPSFKLGGFNKIKNIFIAVSGIAKIRIKGSIKAGNKIFFDASEPGIAKSVLSENKKEIVGISLESYNDDKEKLVWCILRLC
ncbi:MAG: coagulation factor 5/8 type domain protein, partial [Spirochaetia bacterium]|nr:coagulation factor 5/8 type domain protein [Spirochaetia bacterium]